LLSCEDVQEAASSGEIIGYKLYPRGVTTNALYGVSNLKSLLAVFEVCIIRIAQNLRMLIFRCYQKMAATGLVLLVHCETSNEEVDIFDREEYFIHNELAPVVESVPSLRVVVEHISTAAAVKFVLSCGDNVAATITPHHLLLNRTELFVHGLNPHLYCKPILQEESNRVAVLAAATSGNKKFFIGTDCAPHPIEAKQSECCSAGIFHSPFAIELYAEAFDSVNSLDKLTSFVSLYGQQFYGLPANKSNAFLKRYSNGKETRRLSNASSVDSMISDDNGRPSGRGIPTCYLFGESVVVPMFAGRKLHWKLTRM
jgi:dihydroorotase